MFWCLMIGLAVLFLIGLFLEMLQPFSPEDHAGALLSEADFDDHAEDGEPS